MASEERATQGTAAMMETRRPVFVAGENPAMTLRAPGSDRVVLVASFWDCVTSPWGLGHALILWVEGATTSGEATDASGIYTDNFRLAGGLVDRLVRYFREFENVPVSELKYQEAAFRRTYSGERYQVQCRTALRRIELEWATILDRKQVVWPRFPAGQAVYDLTTLICPCAKGEVRLHGAPIVGEVRTAQTLEGEPASSAFLAFAETWIGPLAWSSRS